MLASRRAFTLMEMLVVIGLIAVLVAVVFVVGSAVTSGAKKSLTADGLRVLDNALQAYITELEDNPPPIAEDPRAASDPTRRGQFFPVADARNMTDADTGMSPAGNQMINSAGLFLTQVTPPTYTGQIIRTRPSSTAKAALNALPQRLSAVFDADRAPDRQPAIQTPLDAWGRPMRYVHPAFDGMQFDDPSSPNPNHDAARTVDQILGPARTGTSYIIPSIRRNAVAHEPLPSPLTAQRLPDSDGGSCIGNRPYFYSAGPDGKVGVLHDASDNIIEDYNKDNVYTTRPMFPTKFD
ncbi:MAG: hypothetical protein HBSAPP03_01010 [Phycisphaerae bacterium]|nr:MAG: hypothetical protein HBSAPP03_01010 [Phycisphaerae bacterium]